MQNERSGFKKIGMRILSAFLAFLMLFSASMAWMSRITLQSYAEMTPEAAAADYVSNHDEYMQQDDLSRIYSILKGTLTAPETFADYYQLASISIGQGDYATALEHLETCLSLTAEDDGATLCEVWTKKGSLYALMGNYEQAMHCLNIALENDEANAQARVLRAQIQISQNELQAAAADITRYLEVAGEDAQWREALAQIYETLGNYEQARACYDKLAAAYPGEQAYRLNSLRCQMLVGGAAGALTGYDEMLAQEGNEAYAATIAFLRAVALMQSEQYEQAAEGFADAMARGYDAALCHEQAAACYYALEQHEKTLASGEALLALEAKPAAGDVFYLRMGVAAMSLERYEEAVDYLTRAILLNDQLQGSYYYRGICLLSLQRQQEAIDDFTKSLEQNFLPQYCYYNRGVCYVQLLEYEKALDDMEQTLLVGDDQSLRDAATNILWQMAQYYESQNASATATPLPEP